MDDIVVSERAFLILMFLAGGGKEVHDSRITAVCVADIAVLSMEEKLQTESTVYKNLQVLLDYGFVKHGIPDGRRLTYYISEKGKRYLESC